MSVIIALLANQVIIHLWARPRPFEAHTVTLLLHSTHESWFPSDHATFSFAIAVAVVFASLPLGILSLIFAVFIAFARVYTGEHYVTDVVGGSLIGAFCTLLFWSARHYFTPLINYVLRLAQRLHLG